MCENTAVRWSEYELAKNQLESECRNKVVIDLEKHIAKYRENDFSSEYIQGMERARLLVLYRDNVIPDTTDTACQDKLF
jgi:hypothetical protein